MHKHSEVLKAIAEGLSVEFSFDKGENWQDLPPSGVINPLTQHYLQWRVKPQSEYTIKKFYYQVRMGYGIPVVSYIEDLSLADLEVGVDQESNIEFMRVL